MSQSKTPGRKTSPALRDGAESRSATRSIGVFLPNWVGDVAMATPALRGLRNHVGAQARIVGIGRPIAADVLAGTTWIDDYLFYDPRSVDPQLRGWRFLGRLRRETLATAILMTNSLRTGLLALASGARQRIGYARNGRGPLLTHKLQPLKTGWRYMPSPVLDYYLELVYALGCPPEPRRVELATTSRDEQAADAAWKRLGLGIGEPVVVLNSGGAFGPAKLWPREYFSRLARRIVKRQGHSVLVVCGPAEREEARAIVRGAAHPRVVGLADEPLSVGLSKACVRRAALLVSTDSGPRHFAAGFDVPVVTLFGPTHIAWSENYHPRSIHLQLDLPCGPCQERACPLEHHRCMRELTVDMVYEAVERQLAAQLRTQAA